MTEESLKSWRLIWWLFKLFGFPITIPWLIYHFLDIMQQKRKKKTLNGKVVIITGASSGLGEALAHVFYACGCKIILISRRKEELDRVKNILMNTHVTVPTYPPVVLPIDITNINNLQTEITKIIDIHGRIDILINNAGISYRGEIINTNMDVDIKVMLTNYFAQIALAKVILPYMIKQQSGHIVCISSIQGKISIPYRSAYAASKYALQAWCDCCRAELHDQNIKITIVSPGYIKTSLSLNALTGSGQIYGVMDKTIQEGYYPEYVADRILKAVLKEEKDILITPFIPKAAMYLRTLCPSLYFWIMQKRAKKTKEKE
ncbi:dehydrogenase/reductase SDR family protein 7-like isoform X2 [Apis mellifera]|uniref:Dehydrogenase/reductase SDR family protein 7-like isoform X2 n=1 Tax=Apis mellifera TaxID=7460 RepID=A0A7M7R7K4_APIME|nr:dehydrogenase/reductase SDR family protein 7-like isoform X2 [Apis mellifera]|eukprot:XP_394428.1 dehydrogenase/reductase SDR family protein 7-like isoform X2 [Apis mellifera]